MTNRRDACPVCGADKDARAKTCMACRTQVPLEQRFWAKVDRRGEADCWEWQGSRSSKGYGTFSLGRRVLGLARASRVAYEIAHGSIPAGMAVLHACDNPPCCNPSHLRLGTYSENLHDAYSRGRRPLTLPRRRDG